MQVCGLEKNGDEIGHGVVEKEANHSRAIMARDCESAGCTVLITSSPTV